VRRDLFPSFSNFSTKEDSEMASLSELTCIVFGSYLTKHSRSTRRLLQKELTKFIREHPSITFTEVREEALRWSEEEEKLRRSTHESREVMSDVVESKECNSSTASTPLQQVIDALLKQQLSIEDLLKTKQAMRLVQPHPMNRSWNHQSTKPKRKCFSCRKGHIARYCCLKPPETVPVQRQKMTNSRRHTYIPTYFA